MLAATLIATVALAVTPPGESILDAQCKEAGYMGAAIVDGEARCHECVSDTACLAEWERDPTQFEAPRAKMCAWLQEQNVYTETCDRY